jgi:hypothetical protein
MVEEPPPVEPGPAGELLLQLTMWAIANARKPGASKNLDFEMESTASSGFQSDYVNQQPIMFLISPPRTGNTPRCYGSRE